MYTCIAIYRQIHLHPVGTLASPGGDRAAHQQLHSAARGGGDMGHRVGALARTGSKVQRHGSSQRREH